MGIKSGLLACKIDNAAIDPPYGENDDIARPL
jgi:hypothetical protein